MAKNFKAKRLYEPICVKTANRNMKDARKDRRRASVSDSRDGSQVDRDQCAVDQQRSCTIKSREFPTANNETAICFKSIIMAGPMWHPRARCNCKEYLPPRFTHENLLRERCSSRTFTSAEIDRTTPTRVGALLYLRSGNVNAIPVCETIKFRRLHVSFARSSNLTLV
jgi:hypothetical protein